MEAERALAELLDLNPDVEAAIVLDGDEVLASTLGPEQAGSLARAVRDVVAVAERTKPGQPAPLVQLEAVLRAGSLLVRRAEAGLAAAVTRPESSTARVLHDLAALLARLAARRAPDTADAPA